MERGAQGSADAALALYESLVSPSLLTEIRKGLGLSGGGGLFSAALTIWLCIRRRLEGCLSLELTWLSCRPEEVLRLSPDSARAQRKLSLHESGFDYARHHLPLALVKAAVDHLFAEMRTLLKAEPKGWWVLDGSTLTLEGTDSLTKAFPPACNQHGQAHWPMLKIAVLHELQTGLAMRPEWGPMYGPEAVSEQDLAFKLIARLPEGCGVIADRNFGILQVAWALRNHRMVVRLTDVRARALLKGKATLGEDVDVLHDWRPSAWERSHHPQLDKDMVVPGRIVIGHVLGPKGQKVRVCLFTNDFTSSAQELIQFYTERWRIETDLRSLKHTIHLELSRAKSPDMVVKEFILSVAAYNIVRTVMAQAAQKAGIEPRLLSFARARGCIEIYAARSPVSEESVDQMLEAIAARNSRNVKSKGASQDKSGVKAHLSQAEK